MYLYLKYENKLKRVPNITFQDCVRPQISEVTEERIEPALWFKVLVCDSILVDIDQRLVFWNAEKLQEADYIHNKSEGTLKVDNVLEFFKQRERIFEDGECYDFDPTVDELFDTATNIFTGLCLDVFDREGHGPTYEKIMKMLHVFILPNMRFYPRHLNQLSTVLTWIEKHHERVENHIRKKDTSKRNTENSLRKQREDFLSNEDFSSLKYISTLNDTFLTTLLKHLEKDFRQKNEELMELELQIAPLRSSMSESDLKILEAARSDRDSIHESLQRVVIAREQIKNVISRKHVKKKFKKRKRSKLSTVAGHMLYLQITNGIDEANVEIQELINQKIKISSVREAVLQTIREIKEDGMSYGFNRKKGSFEMETDMFNVTKKPEEWATLQEKVKLMLHVKQAGYRREFERFCERTKLKCQKLFDEAKLFSLSSVAEVPISSLSPGTDMKDRRSARIFPALETNGFEGDKLNRTTILPSFTSRWSLGSISKHECEQICREVIDHLTDTSYNLAKEILGDGVPVPQHLHNKVYICYEEHVSAELMPVLNQVYESSYREQCQSLHTWISSISLSDFGFGDRKMSSLILYNPSSSSSENSRGSSLDADDAVAAKKLSTIKRMSTLDSKSIREMTFEELYNVCSSPDNSLPNFFAGALDMDILGGDDGLAVGDERLLSDDQSDSESLSESSTEADNTESWDIVEEPVDSRSTSECSASAGSSPSANCLGTECSPGARKKSGIFTKLKNSFRSKSHSRVDKGVKDTQPSVQDVLEEKSDISQVNAGEDKENVEVAVEEVDVEEVDVDVTPRPKNVQTTPYSTLPKVKDKFYNSFDKFETFIHEEDQACCLFGKLRQITLSLKYVEGRLTEVRSSDKDSAQISADDLLDIIILLLCRLDEKLLLKLYAHLNLIIHLSPRFMQGNAHDYALTTFTIAYQHLFEQQVLHRPLSIN